MDQPCYYHYIYVLYLILTAKYCHINTPTHVYCYNAIPSFTCNALPLYHSFGQYHCQLVF